MEFIKAIVDIDELLCQENVDVYLDETLGEYHFLTFFSTCDTKIPSKSSKHHYNMINFARKYVMERFDTHLIAKQEWRSKNSDSSGEDYPHIYQAIFYKCDECVLFTLVADTTEDNGVDMIGLVDKDKNYVFVGCSGSHPFIETNAFSYCNSDGSGPNVCEGLEEATQERILDAMAGYYESFCDNWYH